MPGIEFVINPYAAVELAREPAFAAVVELIAERVIETARADPYPIGGDVYRHSFATRYVLTPEGYVAIAYNTDWKARWVEYGAHARGVTPVLGYHILGRAVERVAAEGFHA